MRRLAAALPALVLLAGCQDTSTSGALAGDDLPDCSAEQCASEVEAYGRAVGTLPGVAEVREASYEPEQITDVASVSGAVEVEAGTDCASLEDDLGRLLWESSISPVAAVTLRCFQPGAQGADYEYARYSFTLQDADDLTARWGPRGG